MEKRSGNLSRLARVNFRSLVFAIAVLVVIPSLYYVLAIRSYDGTYSPFDEHTHAGYAWSVSHGNIPAKGDTLPDVILNDLACSGWRSSQDKIENTLHLPSCDSNVSASEYPGKGEQYNSFHPPLYYLITGSLARLLSRILPSLSFVHAARYLSVVWMVAGIVALFFALRSWKISDNVVLSTCALVPYIPVFLNAGTAVTNDAPALLCGAGFLWIASRFFVHNNYSPAIPCVIAFLSCMVKATFAFTLLALLTVCGLSALYRMRKMTARRAAVSEILSVLLIGASALCAVGGWNIFQRHRGDPSYVAAITGTNTHAVSGLPFGEFLNTLMSGFDMSTLPGGDLRNSNASVGYQAWLTLLSVVLSGAVFFLYFQDDQVSAHLRLIQTSVFGMLLFPSLVQIRQFLGDGSMFGTVTPRYGMTILPVILCCWALAVQNRKQPAVSWIISVVGGMVCFFSVLGLSPYPLD